VKTTSCECGKQAARLWTRRHDDEPTLINIFNALSETHGRLLPYQRTDVDWTSVMRRRDRMLRKSILAFAAVAALGTAALTPTAASATWYGHGWYGYGYKNYGWRPYYGYRAFYGPRYFYGGKYFGGRKFGWRRFGYY
jgi:hypothetical protein